MDVMAEYSVRAGVVVLVFALVPGKPGVSVGMLHREDSLLKNSKVLALKEEKLWSSWVLPAPRYAQGQW